MAEGPTSATQFGLAIIGRVSRTFALSIRALPTEMGRAVLVGYLLCRIADTIEDDGTLTAAERRSLLAAFIGCLDDRARLPAFLVEAAALTGSPDHLELVRRSDQVFALLDELLPAGAAAVQRWTRELAEGMREFLARYPDGIRIQTMREYRRYCYVVAGTVGHMITDLWRVNLPSLTPRAAARLRECCEAFGEALQTVNILKDVSFDLEHENAAFVPEELLAASGGSHATLLQPARRATNKAALRPLVALAMSDLRLALDYVSALPKRALRERFSCLIPIFLAAATLREIDGSTAMLEPGGVVKISRAEVRRLLIAASLAALSDRLARGVARRVSGGLLAATPA